jgi:uncharacterized Zn finger protein
MKILKHGKPNFIGKCRRCGCIFLYEIGNLNFNILNPAVRCPECGNFVEHKDQTLADSIEDQELARSIEQ